MFSIIMLTTPRQHELIMAQESKLPRLPAEIMTMIWQEAVKIAITKEQEYMAKWFFCTRDGTIYDKGMSRIRNPFLNYIRVDKNTQAEIGPIVRATHPDERRLAHMVVDWCDCDVLHEPRWSQNQLRHRRTTPDCLHYRLSMPLVAGKILGW
jgi:hypothetical protein